MLLIKVNTIFNLENTLLIKVNAVLIKVKKILIIEIGYLLWSIQY